MRNDEMYLQLYIIRHAESQGNVDPDGDFDKSNPLLTPHGETQAKALGERFSGLDCYTLYSSPLTRAIKTAKCISEEMIIDSGLLEWGVRQTENGFEDFPESSEEALERAKKVIGRLKANHNKKENVIIVTHGMFTQFLLKAALEISDSMRFSVYNASVSKVNFSYDYPPKLALQNDVSHLKETDGEKLFWM